VRPLPALVPAPVAFRESRINDGLTAVTPGPGPAPSHRSSPVPGETGIASAQASAAAPGRAKGLRVLLAEDDAMVARSTTSVLRRLGHSVTHAADGNAAWVNLQDHMHDYDVLVLDVVMPRMNGSDLAHRARAAGFAGPIILVSGLVMTIDPEALALLGIRAFLTKPFLPVDLDRALRGE